MIKRITYLAIITACFSFSIIKEKKFLPPGTVKISETFFADETEVSNFSWQEYEYWTQTTYGHKSKQHLAVLPDTLVWRDTLAYNEPYVMNYYRHPAYRGYPVVGVTYEQVQAFCKWRTDRVKEFALINHKKNIDLEYRLPTKEEWELLTTNGAGILNKYKNEKGLTLLNCAFDSDSLATNADVTAPVYSYWQNKFGLFNTFGNVSEMVNEQGISKGGSWRHGPESCRPGKDIAYAKAESWLGFRCVCVVNN